MIYSKELSYIHNLCYQMDWDLSIRAYVKKQHEITKKAIGREKTWASLVGYEVDRVIAELDREYKKYQVEHIKDRDKRFKDKEDKDKLLKGDN